MEYHRLGGCFGQMLEGVDEYWLLGDILMPGTGRRRILDLLAQLPITVRVLTEDGPH